MAKKLVLYLLGAAALVAIIHFSLGTGLGITAFVIYVGWPLLGTLVTSDDDLPGGWNNLDGNAEPDWRKPFYWGAISLGLGLSALGFAFDEGLTSASAKPSLMIAAVAVLVGVGLLLRDRERQQGSD